MFRTLSLERLLCGLALVLIGAASATAQTLSRADVDRDCKVTAADTTLASRSLNRRCGQTGFLAAADTNDDCVVNNTDLTFIQRNIGKTVCTATTPQPTITASVSPAPNAAGWHRGDVVVSFACTDATTCPSAVTVTTEGAAQVIERIATGPGGTATARVTLSIDRTPPTLSAVWPASVLPGQSFAVPVQAADANGVTRTSLYQGQTLLDDSTARPFVLDRTVPQNAQVGTSDVLDVYAEDIAGNAGSLRRSVPIEVPDTTAPTVRLAVPPTAPPGAKIPLAIEAADERELARVVLSATDTGGTATLEDRQAGPFAFQHVATLPADAPAGSVVTYAALATDAAGNPATATGTVTVVTSVETTELHVTVNPPVSPTFQSLAVITGTIGRAAGNAPPAAPAIIAGIAPASGRQGQAVDVTITGINTTFTGDSLVNFGGGVTVQSVSAPTPTSLVARVVIAANAGIGPRLVAVQSGGQEALLGSAFAVLPGVGTVTGTLLGANGQPIAGARVCLPNTTTCVTTDVQGRFNFEGVANDVTSVVASADGYESTRLRLRLDTGTTAALGDVALPISLQPPPPPLPSAPPVGPKLAVALGRGAADVTAGGNPEALRKLARDTIIAVGGSEIGVLDEDGRQLNPLVSGPGLTSFTASAIEEVADDLIAGDTISLAEIMRVLIGSLQFPIGTRPPSLMNLIAGIQQVVNDAWANPARPEAPLVMVLFNQGRVVSPTPPTINFDTRFNALQRDLLVSSFLSFMATTLPGTQQQAWREPAGLLPGSALPPRFAYRAFPAGALDGFGGNWRPSPLRDGAQAWERGLPGDQPATNAWTPASVTWDALLEKSVPQSGWAAAKQGAGLCDKFLVKLASLPNPVPGDSAEGKQAATDPLAKFLPAPGCKDIIGLAEMALSTKPDYKKIGNSLTTFLTSERVTRANAARVYSSLEHAAFQETFARARTEVMKQSKTLEQAKKFATFGAGLVESSLTKFQGQAVTAIFKLEAELIIEALRPRTPFIRTIEQVPDPATNPPTPSRMLKIVFDRSPNDHGNVESIVWKYYLIRGRSADEMPVAMKIFEAGAPLEFFDEVPTEGTYYYRMRAMRVVGTAVIPDHQPSDTDKVMAFLGGIVPGAGSKTPGGHAMLGIDFVKTLTDPLAEIYRGVHVQASNASDPFAINVSVRQFTRPPANLAIDAFRRAAYMSVPSLGLIYRIDQAGTNVFAAHNFAAPGAVGLARDSRGLLYTDNSASDARFGGRIFSFDRDTGARSHVGSTNYYSLLLQNANPVSVQSLLVAPSSRGEGLYIADASAQRITLMTLPWRLPGNVDPTRNISQPYITSPLFNFSGSTTMAMRSDDTLAITQYDNVLMVRAGEQRALRLFRPGESPFSDLSGVTFDRYQNMYLTDATAGTITMVPVQRQSEEYGFFGLDDVGKRRHVVLRGARRPSDVKLAPDNDGLAFFDGERAFVRIGFGVSGQITRPDGSPLAGATVMVPEVNGIAKTDGDGVFVLSNLLSRNSTPVFDVVIRADNKSQTFVVPLDPYKHNMVDLVFAPPAPLAVPPSPGPGPVPPPPPPPGEDTEIEVRTIDRSTPETVSTFVDIRRPNDPPPPPAGSFSTCPRAVFLRPAYGAGVTAASLSVTGWFTVAGVQNPMLLVNGVAQPIVTSTQDFAASAALLVGQNTLSVAVSGAWLKSRGCVPPDTDDAALVSISGTHAVFHDPNPATLAQYKSGAGFDLSIRGIVRDNGSPLAGISLHVPGTQYVAWTDLQGAFQIDLPSATVAGRAAAVDAVAASLFEKSGSILALIQNDQRAAAIAALESLLAQVVTLQDSPPSAGSSADTVVALAAQIEGIAGRLLLSLQDTGIADDADVTALSGVASQMAGAVSDGEIIVRGREYTDLVIKVKVQ